MCGAGSPLQLLDRAGGTLAGEYAILGLGAVMRGHRGDHVTHPAEQASRADPHPWRDDEPENAAEKIAVVKLSEPREDCTEDGRGSRIAHGLCYAAKAHYVPGRSACVPASEAGFLEPSFRR